MPRCRPTTLPRHLPGPLAALALGALLTACGTETTAPTAASRVTATTAPTMPTRDALPDCSRIAATLGEVLTGWRLMDESGPWDNPGQQGHGMDCLWASPQLQSDDAFEMIQGASLMVRINATPDMLTEADVRTIGWTVDHPAVEALGGYLVYPSGQLDFDAPLGPIAPEVVVGTVAVSLLQSGVMVVNAIEEGQGMTHRKAIDAAVAVHRLIER